METKALAATGVALPEAGIGTWNYHAGPKPLRQGLEAGALFIDTAESYGTETGRPTTQVALNWCLCQDGVVVIPKRNPAAHILDNCGAAGWRLTADQRALLDSRIRYRRRNRSTNLCDATRRGHCAVR